jgi:hypothetical protein
MFITTAGAIAIHLSNCEVRTQYGRTEEQKIGAKSYVSWKGSVVGKPFPLYCIGTEEKEK